MAIDLLYPNGQALVVANFIKVGGVWIPWDGSVTGGGGGGDGAILDGVTASIRATVLSYTNGKPLAISLTDANGDHIATLPISAASLPLPSGASTEATLALIKAKTDNIDVALSTRTKPADAQHAIIDSITAGATVIGKVGIDQTTPGTTNAVQILHGKTIKTVSGSFAADTDVIAAVTSKRIKVFALKVETFGTSATTILWKSNGTGGTEFWRSIVQAITGTIAGETQATSVPSFLFATNAGEKLTADTNTGDTIHYSISYWDDDAT